MTSRTGANNRNNKDNSLINETSRDQTEKFVMRTPCGVCPRVRYTTRNWKYYYLLTYDRVRATYTLTALPPLLILVPFATGQTAHKRTWNKKYKLFFYPFSRDDCIGTHLEMFRRNRNDRSETFSKNNNYPRKRQLRVKISGVEKRTEGQAERHYRRWNPASFLLFLKEFRYMGCSEKITRTVHSCKGFGTIDISFSNLRLDTNIID